jgi:hypothetical protein
MTQSKNISIAVLCVSAVILGTILVLTLLTAPAAANTPSIGANYLMFTGRVTGNDDFLYIVQPATGQMKVYTYNSGANKIEWVDKIELDQRFKEAVGGRAKVPAGP